MSEQDFEFVPGGNGRIIRVPKGAVLPSLPAPTPAPSDDEIEAAMMEIVHQAYAAIEAAPDAYERDQQKGPDSCPQCGGGRIYCDDAGVSDGGHYGFYKCRSCGHGWRVEYETDGTGIGRYADERHELPDGTELAPVSPDVLVANLADWRNDHTGGGGDDKPRVFVLRDSVYKPIYMLFRHVVVPVAFTAVGAGTYHVYRDEVLWIEVKPADVIEALDLLSVAGDLLGGESPTPSDESVCNVEPVGLDVIVERFGLTAKGSAMAAMLDAPTRVELTAKGRRAARRLSEVA